MADATLEPKVTSAHIRAALMLRYPTQSHALLFEVANSTGASARTFADAVAVGLWPSHGHEIEGVEVKVSRSDWLRERNAPEKSQPVFQHCHRWWLACPKGMVQPDELPPTWGLLELTGDVLRVRVKAPKLEPIAPSPGFLAAMLRRHAGADEKTAAVLIEKEVAKRLTEQRARERRDAEASRSKLQRDVERGMETLRAVKEATGLDLTTYAPAEEWVAAVKFAHESWNRSFSRFNLEQMQRSLSKAAGELQAFLSGVGGEGGEVSNG